jgi:hypothetical protein
MGKFYVMIQLSGKSYKLCRDDVGLVHSRQHHRRPPLPLFALRRGPSSSTTNDISDPDESSLQFDPLEIAKSHFPLDQQLNQ